MYSSIDSKVTGFEFHPHYRKERGKEVLKSLELDLLSNGNIITSESYDNITENQIGRMQTQLLKLVLSNLNVDEHSINSQEVTLRSQILGVVNMYRLDIIREEASTVDINIRFISSGYRKADTILKSIPKSELTGIRKFLTDNTAFNFKCKQQCNAVTYIDLVAIIDKKRN